MSSYTERPAPDAERFLTALDEWRAGDETPGNAVRALKRGGFDELVTENAESAPEIVAVWTQWERGKVGPAQTLEELESAGVRDLLARVLEVQREVFGGA